MLEATIENKESTKELCSFELPSWELEDFRASSVNEAPSRAISAAKNARSRSRIWAKDESDIICQH